jgi:biotin operon repressor
MAVHTDISELRANGVPIERRGPRISEAGRKIYEYRRLT